MGQDLGDLAALERADEIPREGSGIRARLGDQLLGAVLAEQRDPGLAQRPQLLQCDVLDRGEDLDLGRDRVPSSAISERDALEVRP